MKFHRACVFVISSCLLCGTAVCQQQDPAATLRNDDSSTAADPDAGKSLADVARSLRKDDTASVQTTAADAKKLFSAVDTIIDFASKDTGFPKRADVKRRLIGKDEVEKYIRAQLEKQEYVQRLAHSEMTMKKFGFLPRDFDLRDFLLKATAHDLAAYYDDETKTISLLNWVPAEQQEPILAHELTHALQDQNYDLKAWMKRGVGTSAASANDKVEPAENDEATDARRAVVEGQAMVVYVDYLLAPMGRNLQNTPGLIYQMEEPAVKAAADSELLHDAPMILREGGTFPYREGLIFEGELLEHGGKQLAFPGPFLRPPANTHEVLDPQAYIAREKLPPVRIPDLKPLLGASYEMYDSGNVGELDVRALLEQYGPRKVAEDLSMLWQGGAYAVFRQTNKTAATTDLPKTADLSLFYVSRWKTPEAARYFTHLYSNAVAQRYQSASQETAAACEGTKCPVATTEFSTEEGPVVIEQWQDNSVTVSESFDTATAAKLAGAVEDAAPAVQSDNLRSDELGMRLYEFPGFMAFQAEIGEAIANHLAEISVR
jgi:hypothetical protein